ncbi:MAG: hypothetical protein E7063_04555 [Spirochaetaceae bacterium]|nr:hypothetical protein [Spirochaetaceae bacterium]
MRTFVSSLLVFFVICIVGSLLGLAVYMLYTHTTMVVAGERLTASSESSPLSWLLYSCAISASVSVVFLINYTIRHPSKLLYHILSIVVTSLLSWLVIIPSCLYGAGHFYSKDSSEIHNLPSARYFRLDSGGVYFYSSIYPDTVSSDGIYIDLNNDFSSKDGIVKISNAPINLEAATPFSDLLIKDTMDIPMGLEKILSFYRLIGKFAFETIEQGFFKWLVFASIGLAFSSLLGLRRLFRWRLLNSISVLVGFFVILTVNALYFSGWNGNIFGNFNISFWLMNCIIALLLSCIGILFALFRKDPNLEADK